MSRDQIDLVHDRGLCWVRNTGSNASVQVTQRAGEDVELVPGEEAPRLEVQIELVVFAAAPLP